MNLHNPPKAMTLDGEWRSVSRMVCNLIGSESFSAWFGRLETDALHSSREQIVLSVPTVFLQHWITTHYSDVLLGYWQQERHGILSVVIRQRIPQSPAAKLKQGLQQMVCRVTQGEYGHAIQKYTPWCVDTKRLKPIVRTATVLFRSGPDAHAWSPAGDYVVADNQIRIDDIQMVTSRHYGITMRELLSLDRGPSLAFPRQVGMYLTFEILRHPHALISRHFRKRNHTSSLYAAREAKRKMAQDDVLAQEIIQLRADITEYVANQRQF